MSEYRNVGVSVYMSRREADATRSIADALGIKRGTLMRELMVGWTIERYAQAERKPDFKDVFTKENRVAIEKLVKRAAPLQNV